MRNPKQDGSNLYDCVPQAGPCPKDCNQCFFNRGYYRETPFVDEVPEGAIVRMNCGHDSNIEKEKVLEAASKYKNVFFNTSITNFDFPGPVVFTANAFEESPCCSPTDAKNLMFVRLRVSSTNLHWIKDAIEQWSPICPVVLTFMAYYTYCPNENYVWKERHVNSYWCPKPEFIEKVKARFPSALVCGRWCKDCGICERLYWRCVNGS